LVFLLFTLKLLELHLGQIDGLIDAEITLRSRDAILRWLRQIEAGASRGAQLGDHLLVVGESHFHIDAGFLLEGGNQFRRDVIRPADDA
jgi:hypothetical protein